MATLHLAFLGSPLIDLDGSSVSVDTRKAVALLAYLAVGGETQRREALAALLYPDYDESRARAALRRTLSALRRAVGGEWVEADRQSVALISDQGVRCDVTEFTRLMRTSRAHEHGASRPCPECIGRLRAAAELYRGDFLEGFSLRDSVNFDDWQFFQAEHLRQELAWALDTLTGHLILAGELREAIVHARRWLALDSLNEPAHRRLMQLYAWTDQQAAALRQYQECARILAEELGVEPLAETTALYEAIREHRLPAPRRELDTTRSMAPEIVTASALPLVGRDDAWAILLRAYHDIHEHGRLVILSGEAGIGKTRLADEFLLALRPAGAQILRSECFEGEEDLALGPVLASVLPALEQPDRLAGLGDLPDAVLSEASRLFPVLTSHFPQLAPPSPSDRPGARSWFFESIGQVLFSLTRGAQPGVLFLDDMQWADDATLELVAYLARRLQDHPWCLLLAWRSEPVSPQVERLQGLIAEARRARRLTEAPLERLPSAAVEELAVRAVGSALDHAFAARLYQVTEGLPFFVAEYLALLQQAGELAPEEWPLPGGIRDLMRARLKGVSETVGQILTTGAVIGRSFDLDTVRGASGRGEEETVRALDEAVAAGLIVEGSEEGTLRYDFRHDQLRSMVYEETSLARRRLLHRRVAETLVARFRSGSDPIAGAIAHHYRLAGDTTNAAEFFRLAGDYARSLYANADALAHYRAALTLGFAQPATLHEAIGDLLTLSGDYGEAIRAFERAAGQGSAGDLARLEHKLGEVYQRQGEWQLAETHYQAAIASLPAEAAPGLRARIHADRSLAAHRGGETGRAWELAQEALLLAETADDRQALAQAHNLLGILARSQGDPVSAEEHLSRSLALAQALEDPAAQVAALNNLALTYADQPGQALALTEEALDLCAALGDRHRQAALHNHIADLLHVSGQEEAAMSHLIEAVRLFAEIEDETQDYQPEIWKLVSW